ncbi:hypothetical protein [Enorma burkinafasonensis]|uniref:hypothetical protein n=1 Tax=Enorma burkinafasonensis TaxID=2590867 RepID=UPI0011A04B44|nr:hypothetical protein [Enorma burkinafasonensis]
MSHEQRPALTAGNRIYLYNLLRQAIGCGRQTFMTRVEEALVADDLAPQDLGFVDARELMEELSEFARLTVFKGGRIYVTLVAQPAWDEALDAADAAAKKPAGGQGKPWKRKRGDKTVKPVRPRHVPRVEEEPAPEAEPVAAEEAAPEAEPLAAKESADAEATSENPEGGRAAVEAHDEAAETTAEEPAEAEAAMPAEEMEASGAEEAMAEQAGGTADADSVADAPEAALEEGPTDEATAPEEPAPGAVPPAPSISLTITYIPEDLETDAQDAVDAQDVASPQVGAAAAGETAEPAAQASPAGPDPVPENLIPRNDGELPEGFPRDFAQDVYCPAPLLRELGYLLPYGADALGILTEYYYIAHLRGELEHGRGQASFPLRYTQSGERRSVTVRIRRRAQGTPGAPWEVSELEDPTADKDSAPAN